jgi:succinate dehydrogenase hydrophobic anchor subunit
MILGRKKLLISIGSVLLLVLIIAGLGVFTYWNGVRKDLPIEKISDVKLVPVKDQQLGKTVTAEISLKCPWHRYPVKAELVPGKGSQLVGAPVCELKKRRWGYNVWLVKTKVQPYRTGEVPAGNLEVFFNQGKDINRDLNMAFKVPGFKVKAADTGKSNELSLASEVKVQTKVSRLKNIIIVTALVLIVFIIAIVYYLIKNRGKKIVVLSPWAAALQTLLELRRDLGAHKIDGVACFSVLTDIVRGYLEKRFRLHAPTQTTDEFLRELERPLSPLNEGQRHFLKEFMQAADLVKFANLPADTTLLETAMDKAEKLVEETRPEEDKK